MWHGELFGTWCALQVTRLGLDLKPASALWNLMLVCVLAASFVNCVVNSVAIAISVNSSSTAPPTSFLAAGVARSVARPVYYIISKTGVDRKFHDPLVTRRGRLA